jgi:hypothetical protein
VNPYGIHETGPALPFAKALRVNSFGIHENRTGYLRSSRAGPALRTARANRGGVAGESAADRRTRGGCRTYGAWLSSGLFPSAYALG